MYQPQEFTVEFGEIGYPDVKAVLRDPLSLKAAEQLKLQKAQFILLRASRGYLSGPEDDWAIGAMHEAIRPLLREWNVPGEDGEPLAVVRYVPEVVPKQDEKGTTLLDADGEPVLEETGRQVPDPTYDPLGEMPGEFYGYLVSEVGRRLMTPPKRRK